MEQNRRRAGRPRNQNLRPCDAHLACRHEDIDELDRLIGFPRMPLGVKFSHLLAEYKQLKNLKGQLPTSQSSNNKQSLIYEGNWTDEELKLMKEAGWA